MKMKIYIYWMEVVEVSAERSRFAKKEEKKLCKKN